MNNNNNNNNDKLFCFLLRYGLKEVLLRGDPNSPAYKKMIFQKNFIRNRKKQSI